MFDLVSRGFVPQKQSQLSKILKESDSGDSGAEEECEILGQEEIKEHRHSEDSGNCSEAEGEFEVLDSESQEIPATPCSTSPEDLSLENAILANFPDGCDRSFTVELKDEDSYGIIPKNLTFAEIINILNQAIQEDNCEELDKVVQNIEDYEGRSITLDNVNLKSFCEQQLNLDLNRSDHQHIYSNVLSQYKFDQEGFKYDYPVKELVLLAIAANDKLTEKYQDRLFIKENLGLFPLLVSGQEYVKAFIGRFHDTDGIYGRLKDQTIQLVEPNKIDFFSVIALRKEQELLNAVFVEYVLRDFGQVLKTSKPDPSYGVLETASLIKNEEFITIVLDAFERYINELTKKASTEELLKKSFATLLETAISQEHISVVEYLCKRYTNSTDHAIYDVYEQAFADDKVITILRQQILKNIGARGRKEIYDLILKTALDAGNIAFIEHLCKECAECSNDVINYLDHKSKNNEFDEIYESILVALSNTGSQNIIASVLAHVQIYQSIPNNKQQVVRQTIQSILRNAIKEANCEVVVLLCQHVDLKFAALQAIYKEEFEKVLPVVAEQLEKISMELFPSMTRNEYQKNRDTLDNLYLIRSLLESSKLINTSSKANIQTQTGTQVNKGSSNNAASPISAMIGETATSSQVVNEEDNNQSENPGLESAGSKQPQENVDKGENIMNNGKGSTEELISNSFEEGEMHSSDQNTKSIEETLSYAIFSLDCKEVRSLVERVKQEDNNVERIIGGALKEANETQVGKRDKGSKDKIEKIRAFLAKELKSIAASLVGNDVKITASSQAPVNIDDEKKQAHAQPAEHVLEESAKLKAQPSNTQKQQGDQQDSPPLSPQSSASGNVEGTKASANAAPVPTPNSILTSIPDQVPTSVPPVTSKSSGQADNVQINGKQSTNPHNGSVTEPVQPAPPKNASLYVSNTEDVTNSEDIPVVNGASSKSDPEDGYSSDCSDASYASTVKATEDLENEQQDSPPLLPQSSVSGGEYSGSSPSFINVPTSDEGGTDNSNSEVSSEDITKEGPTLKGSSSLQDIQPEISVSSPSASPNVDDVPTIEEHMVITADIEDSSDRLAGKGDQQNSQPPLPSFDLSSPQRPVDDEISSIADDLRSEAFSDDDISSLDMAGDECSEVSSEDGTQNNISQPTRDSDKNNTAPQNTQKSKLPTVVTWTLAVAGILAGVAASVAYFAFGASLLVAGITAGVGAWCLVAAAVMYCFNSPASSLKDVNTYSSNKELAETTVKQ